MEIKLATSFISDDRDRISKELTSANRTIAQSEDVLMKKDEQIRDLSKPLIFFFHKNHFSLSLHSERDMSTLQLKLKDSKKVTVREPAPTPSIVTQSRLAQTDPWIPSPASDKPADDSNNNEFQLMMQTRVEALERKYQTIIEQKNSQIQQLIQEV